MPQRLDTDSLTGRVLDRRYRLGGLLGEGACGVVFDARSLPPALADHGRRRVAVKVLARRRAHEIDAVSRFTHEAFLGTILRHPGIVRVLDFGRVSDGRPYYAMELCRGTTLRRLLIEVGVLPASLALDLIEDAAAALTAMHRNGIVHRDVKPSNLLVALRSKGRPRLKIADLGVAGVFDPELARRLGSPDVGAAGSYGTPAYIAPEQALGLRVDARADIYALGCIAYRMLAGADPLRGSSMSATVRAHLFETPPAASRLNPALPRGVDAALAHALEKDRDQRTPTAVRLAAELRAAFA